MTFTTQKSLLILLIVALFSTSVVAQKVLYKSDIVFTESQLSNFYSSFVLDSTQVYFNANDYNIYAFDKNNETKNWSYYLSYKANYPPIAYQNFILADAYDRKGNQKCIQINATTGDTIRSLTINAPQTKPYFKNDIMYCTTINPEVGGVLLAFDLKKNTMLWNRFVAHGVSTQPYFFADKIIANAESDNWFEIDYSGKLLDTKCKTKAEMFVQDIPCVRNFRMITHDKKELNEAFFAKNLTSEVDFTFKSDSKRTFILTPEWLLILGDNKKILDKLDIYSLDFYEKTTNSLYMAVLKSDNEKVWFILNNTLVHYDYKSKKVVRSFDCSEWLPTQVQFDGKNLWLISGKDGQLYKIGFED